MYFILFLLCFIYLIPIHLANNININNHDLVPSMINDYLLNQVSSSSYNSKDNTLHSFILNMYENDIIDQNQITKKMADWINIMFTKTIINSKSKSKLKYENYMFKEIGLLNKLIINATDGLLNMCDKLIEKTTSVLPLSYQVKLTHDMNMYSDNLDNNNNDNNNNDNNNNDNNNDNKALSLKTHGNQELAKQIVDDLYYFQQHRDAISNRQLFLNGLCFYTFGTPYVHYYISDYNMIEFEYDPSTIRNFIAILQNIIDNSYIRGLNKGFKMYKERSETKIKKGKSKGSGSNYDGLRFDVELDIDTIKTESLVEKAKYMLPILQKFEQQLPTYLTHLSKRSLNIETYFMNLNAFWQNILNKAYIGSQLHPFKYEAEMLEVKKKKDKELLEKDKKKQAELEIDLMAESEAAKIIREFKNKQLIEEAKNYVREQEIIQKDRKTNYSIIEWDQFNRKIKQHVFGFTNTLVSGIDGAMKAPKDFVIDFATETVLDIGKVVVLALVLMYCILYSFKKIKYYIFYNKDSK
jgi:hypothetical protein